MLNPGNTGKRDCRKLIISEYDSLRIEGEQAAVSAGLISQTQKIPVGGLSVLSKCYVDQLIDGA